MATIEKAFFNGVRRTDHRSHNHPKADRFEARYNAILTELRFYEDQAEVLREKLDGIEHAWMDAQDACWDGVL